MKIVLMRIKIAKEVSKKGPLGWKKHVGWDGLTVSWVAFGMVFGLYLEGGFEAPK